MYQPNFTKDRDEQIEWARRVLQEDFVVLDTETTGTDEWDEIVSVGVVGKDGKILLDTLIKPSIIIPAGATRVHGLRDEDVADAPTIAQVWPLLFEAVENKAVLIYNALFDVRLINQSLKKHNIDVRIFAVDPIDVMLPASAFYGEWNDYYGNYRWQKLTVVARSLGIDTAGAHGAAADALMTLRVVEAMAATPLSTEIYEDEDEEVDDDR